MAKIGTFIISMIIVSLFAGVFAIFISQGTTNYGVDFDNSSMQTYNRMSELANLTEDIKESTESRTERTGVLDLIGAFFSDAYNVLLITLKSFGMFEDMSEQALEDAHLGSTASLFRVALISIVIIVIFLTVISLVIARKSGEI